MPTKYDEATKTRTVRLAVHHRDDYDSEWGRDVGGIGPSGDDPETLRKWVCRAEVDAGDADRDHECLVRRTPGFRILPGYGYPA